jgi:hypothetical protein
MRDFDTEPFNVFESDRLIYTTTILDDMYDENAPPSGGLIRQSAAAVVGDVCQHGEMR